jgi:hypothetical protein
MNTKRQRETMTVSHAPSSHHDVRGRRLWVETEGDGQHAGRKPGALTIVNSGHDCFYRVARLARERNSAASLITGELSITADGIQPLGGILQVVDRPDDKLEPVGAHLPSSSCRAATLASC